MNKHILPWRQEWCISKYDLKVLKLLVAIDQDWVSPFKLIPYLICFVLKILVFFVLCF